MKLIIYYKTKKLSNLFIKNNIHRVTDVADKHNVVYLWTCNRDGCDSTQTYLGFTTCTVRDRFRMHTQASSSIKKHLTDKHSINRVTTAELLTAVKILSISSDRRELVFTESLLIKSMAPRLNAQNEGFDKILKVFKH